MACKRLPICVRSILVFFIRFHSFIVPSVAVCPSPVAYEVPIRNVSLSDGTTRRGAAFSIGGPSTGQPFAFNLNCQLNNTYIFDNVTQSNLGGCNNNGTFECTAQLGGLFNESASTTWAWQNRASTLSIAPEDPFIEPNHTTDLWGTDVFAVTPALNMSNFPLGVSRNQGETMNSLGLSRNSTIMNALVQNGDLAARVWSFWQGWTGAEPEHQIDGNLILGGYDAEKVMGPNITLPTGQPEQPYKGCYLVTVTDIRMNLKNGSSPSLFGSNNALALKACVEPHFTANSIPEDLWDSFLSISGSTYVGRSTSVIAFWGMLIEADGAYDGNLTYSIDPGLDITIPNHQLVVPDYDIDSYGQTFVKNDSNREVLLSSLQFNQGDVMVLGLPFFTSAYMMADNDREQFTLWQAQATTKSNIIPMAKPGCQNTSAAADPVPSTAPGSSPIGRNGLGHAAISKGTIAGVVVGGITGIALFFACFFVLRSRRAREAKGKATSFTDESARPVTPILYKSELASDRQPPQEMPLVQDPDYEDLPHELSEERLRQELPVNSHPTPRYEMSVPTPKPNDFELPVRPALPRSAK